MRGLTLLLALCLAGCAVLERDNRRLLSALDDHATPQSAAARWALAPLAFSLGVVAAASSATSTFSDARDLPGTGPDERLARHGREGADERAERTPPSARTCSANAARACSRPG